MNRATEKKLTYISVGVGLLALLNLYLIVLKWRELGLGDLKGVHKTGDDLLICPYLLVEVVLVLVLVFCATIFFKKGFHNLHKPPKPGILLSSILIPFLGIFVAVVIWFIDDPISAIIMGIILAPFACISTGLLFEFPPRKMTEEELRRDALKRGEFKLKPKTKRALKILLLICSIIVLSVWFGVKAGLVLMVGLFIHEYGHIFAMKRRGMKVSGIYFLPGFGAGAVPEEDFLSREAEAFVALAGVFFGMVYASLLFCISAKTEQVWIGFTASFFALINLFNLLPLNPLDGGRIVKSIFFSLNSKVGLLYMAVIPIAVFILLLGGTKSAFLLIFLLLFFISAVVNLAVEFGDKKKGKTKPKMRFFQCCQTFILYIWFGCIFLRLYGSLGVCFDYDTFISMLR